MISVNLFRDLCFCLVHIIVLVTNAEKSVPIEVLEFVFGYLQCSVWLSIKNSSLFVGSFTVCISCLTSFRSAVPAAKDGSHIRHFASRVILSMPGFHMNMCLPKLSAT